MDIIKLFDISGKTALVTGGSSGIGYMIAEGLARAGAQVWICSRKQADIDAAAARLSAFGTVRAFAADLSTEAGIAQAAASLGAAPLHILVNNAGATSGASRAAFPRKGFEKVLNLNLLAPFALVQALLPALKAAGTTEDPARVINIASIDGIKLPMWESYPYSATKAGLIHMTRHLGKFLAPENVSVNAIAPGFFASKMSASALDLQDEAVLEEIASPLGHRMGTTEDMAGAVIYLSSRAGAWLSGVTLPVSGGYATID